MFAFFKALPVQLLFSIAIAFLLGKSLDLYKIRVFFTVSSCFVEVLLFILPVMVFCFIFRALVSLKRGSTRLVFLIIGGVMASNSLALLLSYGVSQSLLPILRISHVPSFSDQFRSTIEPLFAIHLPKILGTDKAMTLGVTLGILFTFLPQGSSFKERFTFFVIRASDGITFFLKYIFIPLLPVYVFGFCLKLSYEQALIHLFEHYGRVFLLSIALVGCYLFLLYFIGASFSLKRTFRLMQIMFPAGMTGFCTMSSAATMPVTLKCTEETTQDKDFTHLIIPTTSNIHMLGDDLTIVITAITLLILFGHEVPHFSQFLLFTGAFCVAKLSCVGIPGASVLVVLPALEQFLGLTPEMISVLTTIYILQDPFGTAANVMGNGAFALIVQRIFRRAPLPSI